ncbi:UNVERIFIED_CONTAM: hypothetical protein HDU68_001319 [Siphonaria sp. JEL0065]|nr:hypothetical protein HDU68_001319 [Siphonaria sp. JEL0065]
MLIWTTPTGLAGISSTGFTCEACLKGHRSNSCSHWTRKLVEVKGKGRPVSQCSHCRTRRSTGSGSGSGSGGAGEDASSSPPSSTSTKKSRSGHSHHKCMCGLQVLAATKRNIEARFYTAPPPTAEANAKGQLITLCFTTTDHAALLKALESAPNSSLSVQSISKAAKSTAAAVGSSAIPTSPALSIAGSSPQPGEGGSSSSTPIQQHQQPIDAISILFDSLTVSVPDQTALILDNPCSCAFGNPCICGDLSLKKPKSKAASQPKLNLTSSTTSLHQPQTLAPMPAYTLPSPSTVVRMNNLNVNALASIQQQTALGYRPILPQSMAIQQPMNQRQQQQQPQPQYQQQQQQFQPQQKSCCGSKNNNITSSPPITTHRQDDVMMVNALLGLKQSGAGSNDGSEVGSSNQQDDESADDGDYESGAGCGCGCSCGTAAVVEAISSGGGCCSSREPARDSWKAIVIDQEDTCCGGGSERGGGGGCCS